MNIKLISDGSDGGSFEDDILKENMSSVDTSFPVLPTSVQDFQILEVTKAANSKGTGNNLVISMKTTQENIDPRTKDTIQVGFPCKTYIGLTESEKYSRQQIKKAVATFCQAVGVESVSPLDQFTAKIVTASVSMGKATAEYPNPGNQFRFVPLKQKS